MKSISLLLLALPTFFSACERSSDNSEIQALREEVARLKATKQQLPSATELFDLRAKCNAMGDALLKEQYFGNGLFTVSQVSRYDIKSGRCFVDLRSTGSGFFFHRKLYDGHTKALLADQSHFQDGTKNGVVFNDTAISGFDAVGEYITKMMIEE